MIKKRSGNLASLLLIFVLGFTGPSGRVYAKDKIAAGEMIRTLNQEITAANERQDLPGAIQAATKAVQVAKTEFGISSLEVADAMNNLGNLCIFANRAAEAEQLLKQTVLIYLERKDRKSTEMADLYVNLAIACAAQKKYSAALKVLNKAMIIRREKLGPDNIATKKVEEMMEDFSKLAYPNAEKI